MSFDSLPGDVLTLILKLLHNKDVIVFSVCLSRGIQKLCKNVNWLLLIDSHHVYFSNKCKNVEKNMYTQNRISMDAQYQKAYKFYKSRTWGAYYLVAKEKHEQKFGMSINGICDSPEQLARRFPKFKGYVYLGDIRRKDQPKKKGFRAHKWGTNYSDIKNQPEYLYDANGKNGNPLIDEIWIFYRFKSDYSIITCTGFRKYKFEYGHISYAVFCLNKKLIY